MKYRKGYEYQLEASINFRTQVKGICCRSQYISLTKEGILHIKEGYAWDGASGPTFNTDNTMTPSLYHDAMYQLMRMDMIPDTNRELVDKEFVEMLKSRGMSWIRRSYWLKGVRWFGSEGAQSSHRKEVYEVA
jgi:hypothetical protein